MSYEEQSEQRKEEHRLDLFRHNQIAFLVTHDQISDDGLPATQLEAWTERLKEQLNKKGWELADPPPRSYSFPAVGNEVSGDVPPDDQQEQLVRPFSFIGCHVKNERSKGAKMRLLDLILSLDQERSEMTSAFPVLTVEGAFPIWIASGGKSDSGGTGGPGSDPIPFTGTSGPVPYYFGELISKLKNNGVNGKKLYGDGTGVDVAILDTAPCAHDLVLAYKELVLLPEEGKKHPLLKNLLGPNGRLKLYPASYEELLRMGNTSLNRRGYKMADHGLFIAGIVHSIVPNATIHLIEVLNQFGVGDLESIARGFAKAFAIFRANGRRGLANGSFTLEMPDANKANAYRQSDEESIPKSERDVEEQLQKKLDQELKQLKAQSRVEHPEDEVRWVFALRVMCERLGRAGMQVIAAAGNEGQKVGGQRNAPDARYPAAFSKVVGVGALPKGAERSDGMYDASTFSNLADKPPQTGVMALGGEPGAENGVLGIYLGEFPPGKPKPGSKSEHGWDKIGERCENGWAWWAGTSFATPIVTGTIAAVLSVPANPSTTQAAVGALYTEGIIEDAKTNENEDVMSSSLIQSVPPSA